MIRWMFFFNEGSVKSDVTKEPEDTRIAEFIGDNPKGLLALPGDTADIYINLDLVKCITRQIVDEAAEKLALEQAQAQALQHQQQAQ